MANEKDVRDAAGNLIGTAKAQVVRDPFGKIIGEVGPPEPEPGPSAEERITQGFIQKGIDAQNEIGSIMEQMARDAAAAKKVVDLASQWDWKRTREASKKKAELQAKFEEDAVKINKLKQNVGYDPGSAEFKKDVDRFVKNLRQHFNYVGPFNPHRN